MACFKLNFNVDVNSCLSGLWASLRLGSPKSSIQKLKREMIILTGKRDDIKNKIDQAELEGRIPTNQVRQWLREVETVEGQVSDIEQEFQSISCFSCRCFNQTQTQQTGDQLVPIRRESSNCCSIILKVAEKLGEVEILMERADRLEPVDTVGPPETTVMLSMSHRPPVGIKSYVDDIVGYVDDGEGAGIIGIYGMGGVGKTTILKSIQQHYHMKSIHNIFDPVIWVVASKDCQLKRLQMDIAKSLRLNTLQESDDERTCGEKLFRYLKNRNCLLLLDDIWEHLDLQLLGMAHSPTERSQQQQQPRKIVVFTTRSETVCAQMKAEKKIKVKCLDPDEEWRLFEQNSDGDVLSSDAGIKFVAEQLAKECAGLPLALVTVARAMSGKRSWESWNDALHQIRDEHEWTTIGLPDQDSLVMYKAFKLSYDSLENDSVRECLLCCALWPEDYQIYKFGDLIPLWIGCGIIHEFNVINEAFAKGYSHLEALVAASLLEQCSDPDYPYEDELVKMHDVIRDMALLMVSGLEGIKRKWIVKAGIGLSDLPRQEEWQETERASFMMNKFTSLPEYAASTFPKLSMFLLSFNYRVQDIPSSLFASMPLLTYLDLRGCGIRELPGEICSLTELRYLNLSSNRITRLPAEFGCLGKLEYLFLVSTCIEIVPHGTISNLSMLKWLDIAHIYSSSRPQFTPEWWWDELKCFKGRHQLSVSIDINATTEDIEHLNMLPNVSIWRLTLQGIHISKPPNYDLGTPRWVSDKLEFLRITNLGLDRLELAAGESSFGCLKILIFHSLHNLEEISLNRVRLYNLRRLSISDCPMLKDVSWILLLPCLNIVEVINCEKMKELISEVGGNSDSTSSSSIQSLILHSMPNLNCIANRPLYFPFLKYIHVRRCPKLKKLPFGAEILKNRLKEIVGEKAWWNDLDWNDQSIKESLTPYFRSSQLDE